MRGDAFDFRLVRVDRPDRVALRDEVAEDTVSKLGGVVRCADQRDAHVGPLQRFEHHGSRAYDFDGMYLPSVTTVLAKSKDQSYITRWKDKVGEQEAERIKNLSSKRGTSMHKFLEKHIAGTGYDDLSAIGIQAKPMAQKIIDIGLTPITEYYGAEVTLHYPGLYAGATDLVCLHNDKETIVDFKQANRPKQRDWIEDYYIQIAAYAMAHDYIHRSQIEQGIIMVCTPDLYFQEFKFSGVELRS